MKLFNTMKNVGTTKYLVNYHNGIDTHKDGSRFFNLKTFKNKKDLIKFQVQLKSEGYMEGNSNFIVNELILEKCYIPLNDDELVENCEIIAKKIDERFGPICSGLNISVYDLQNNIDFHSVGNKRVRQFIFGVQDKFGLIEDYLCEIKESKYFKDFIKTKRVA